MLFWSLFALMTGAAAFAVLWPLGRARKRIAEREADLAVYRDQLAELERDRARGLLAENEAEAARVEVSRRILAASDASGTESVATGVVARRRVAALIALGGVPVFAIALYLATGAPHLPDAPLAARLAAPPEQQDIATLIRRIETHLAQNPNDGRGWELLAPVYLRMGRPNDAVQARLNALRLLGSTAAREADLGEALMVAADGVVTSEARAAFDRAVRLDPDHTKTQFFLGVAAEQDGRAAQAVSIWRELTNSAGPDDPWRDAALRRIQQHESGTAGQQRQ